MQEPEKLFLVQKKKNKKFLEDRGFLLLEVLISIVIIATTLIIINRAFSTSLRAVRLAGDYLLASYILEDKIFDIQIEESFADARISDTVQLNQKDFFYSMNISPAEMPELEDIDTEEIALKEATLSVNWSDADTDNVSRVNVFTYVWEKEEE